MDHRNETAPNPRRPKQPSPQSQRRIPGAPIKQPQPERSAAQNRSAARQAPRKRSAAPSESTTRVRAAAAKMSGSRPRTVASPQPEPRAQAATAAKPATRPNTARPSARPSAASPERRASRASASAAPTVRSAAGNSSAKAGIAQFASELTPARIGILAGGVLLLLLLIFGISRCTSGKSASESEGAKEDPNRVSFVAVGDNLPDDFLAEYADAWGGEVGDGEYDWKPLYKPIKDYVSKADLSYVKQETHCGGDDIGPKGYPSFNTTDSMADAIVDTGFDLVASASNHSYDWGAFGANEHSRSVWNDQPVVYTGTATSEDEADELAIKKVKGITFALLDYTYGVNGYNEGDLKSYEVNFIDKDRIAEDVERAKEEADVVLVAMHWGTENQTTPDDMQLEYAQYLADLGVDVILGSHPHVIGQLTELEGEDGNKTLCAYSLGNFVSRHETPGPINELEGMLTCDFVRDEESGKVTYENVTWVPLVNHNDGETAAVYALKDYTEDLASAHRTFGDLEDPIAWLKEQSAEIVGEEFTIDD